MWGLLLDTWLMTFVGLAIGSTAGTAYVVLLLYRGKPELAPFSARLRVAIPLASAVAYLIGIWFV